MRPKTYNAPFYLNSKTKTRKAPSRNWALFYWGNVCFGLLPTVIIAYRLLHSGYGVIITADTTKRDYPVKKGKSGMAKQKQDVTVKEFIARIDTLIPDDNNPRKINQAAFEKLKKSLQEFPEMKQLREIVIDENNKILGGTQRYYALKDLGYTDVNVKQVFGFTDKQKREFIIKDNTASGEWDTDILANTWDISELEQWGMPNYNFGDIKEPKEPAAKDNAGGHDVECPNCGFEFEA